MHDEIELLDDDTTVTFDDQGNAQPTEHDPIRKLTMQALDLRARLQELVIDNDELRKAYDDAVRQHTTDQQRHLREVVEINLAADKRDENLAAEMAKAVTEREEQIADLKDELRKQNAYSADLAETINHLNFKLSMIGELRDLLDRLTLAADERARKNALEIVISDVEHLGWDTADLKLQATRQMGLSEAYHRVNGALSDIVAGREQWERNNWS